MKPQTGDYVTAVRHALDSDTPGIVDEAPRRITGRVWAIDERLPACYWVGETEDEAEWVFAHEVVAVESD